jgi:Plasmid replication region DNA-binding N-term
MTQAERSSYGTARDRRATVSFADIEATACRLMASGGYPSVSAVRKDLKRGSSTTVAEGMRRFWKNQAALNAGNPVALTRLPPEFAEAAAALWEQALRLSQQTATVEGNAARQNVENLHRDIDHRVRSVELREKEWDMAARLRERALSDAREQIGLLMKELTRDRAELRARDGRIADLEIQVDQHRRQLAVVIARAVSRNRALRAPVPRRRIRKSAKTRVASKKHVKSRRSPRRRIRL